MYDGHYDTSDLKQFYSASTVAELGKMLPMRHNYGAPQSGKCNDSVAQYIHRGNLWNNRSKSERCRLPETFIADTEADARAKMLVYLIENGLVEVES